MDNFSRYNQFSPYPPMAGGMDMAGGGNGLQAGFPMPFYQMFAYPRALREEQENERDAQRMMAMYPAVARDVQRLVEDECDKMEYDGSMMYDEQPDQLILRQIVRSIYEQMKEQYPVTEENQPDEELSMQEGRRRYPPDQNWLSDLISVMLGNEMHRRRCRRRHCRRFY